MRDFLDAGIKAAPGSDFTASPAEPMLWLYSEVTRTDATGHIWGANQRITVEEAIRCQTVHGAYASFEEDIKGALEPGMLADLVVWDRDLLHIDPGELLERQARANDGRGPLGVRGLRAAAYRQHVPALRLEWAISGVSRSGVSGRPPAGRGPAERRSRSPAGTSGWR